jgi:hypothetical protein
MTSHSSFSWRNTGERSSAREMTASSSFSRDGQPFRVYPAASSRKQYAPPTRYLPSSSTSKTYKKEAEEEEEKKRNDAPDDDDNDTGDDCPVCAEQMDDTDKALRPCPCGYRMCVWCFDRIKSECTGKCPACRRSFKEAGSTAVATYDSDNNYAHTDRIS